MNPLRFLMLTVGVYYFLQAMGGNPGVHFQSLQKYLKEVLKFSPTEMSVFMTMIIFPWTIKPLYGLISDFLPIFGSRRKSYFILTGILGAGAYLALSWSGFSKEVIGIYLVASAVSFAFSDVVCDALMVERGQPLKATDRLQSVQWAASGLAGIFLAYSKGYIAEHWTFQQALWLAAVPPVLVILFTVFALKEEPAPSAGENAKRAWGGLTEAVQSKTLWLTALFLFLFNCNPNLGSVFYFYEKDALKFSDGLIGKIDAVGSMSFMAGTVIYSLFSKRLSHAALLKVIILTGVLGNISYLFFRDAFSGYLVSGFSGVVSVVALLGILTVAAKACPKYAEGSVFALLMSVFNLGARVGDYTGSYIYERTEDVVILLLSPLQISPRLADLLFEKWYSGMLNVVHYLTPYSLLVIIAALFTASMWFFRGMAKEN